jgi:hypothetical protein
MYLWCDIRMAWYTCGSINIWLDTPNWLNTPIRFQGGSLGCAHRTAWGPKSPDEIGLFGLLPPGEDNSPYSCGSMAEAPFGLLLIWAWKLLRKAASSHSPPPDILCEDFIELKSLVKVLERAWTWLSYRFQNLKISSLTTKLQLSQNQ